MSSSHYTLPIGTGIEKYPVFVKSLELSVRIGQKTANFPHMHKYSYGITANQNAIELVMNVVDGLSLPILRAKDKMDCFEMAARCLKRINATLTIANCIGCISDANKGFIDEIMLEVASQLRKTSNGLRKILDENIGAASGIQSQENV